MGKIGTIDETGFAMPTRSRFVFETEEMRVQQGTYLGMVIQEGKITMDSVKVKGLRDWPVPTTVKQVRSFLGFGNFYRKFIKKFSELA